MKSFLISAAAILIFWAVFVPAFEYPDEQAHFATVSLRAEQNRMPKGQDLDVSKELALTEEVLGTLRDGRGNNRYTYHPENKHLFSGALYGPREGEIVEANSPANRQTYVFKEAARYPLLYYAYSGVFYKSVFDQSILDRLFAVRIGSVILAIFNLVIAYKIGQEVFENDKRSGVVAALVVLQPMMSVVMTGVNSDVLHNLFFSLIMLFCLRIIKYDLVGDSIFYLGVFTLLDFLTKPQSYISLPIILVAFVLRAVYQKKIWSSLKYVLVISVIGISIGLMTKNPQLLKFIENGTLPFFNSKLHPDAPSLIEYARYSIDRLIHQNIVWYWGVFRWLGVVLPPIFWQAANRLVVMSALGLIIGFLKNFSKTLKITTFFLMIAVVIYVGAIFFFDWNYIRGYGVQVAVQARYYFPLFTAQMALLYAGLLGYSKNPKYRYVVSVLLVGFFIALQLGGIYTIAKSYFDTSSLNTLFMQASQYKPIIAKGHVWWIWGALYLLGLANIFRVSLKRTN